MSLPDDVTWVGRHREIAAVGEAVRAVVEGQGQVLFVEGEPGIGKSALAGAAMVEAGAAGCQVLRASADELTARFPLQVLADALGIRGLAVSADTGDRALPDRATGSAAPWALGDPVFVMTERILTRIDQLCVALPTVLVLDDLQWADEASLVALARLVASTDQMALLLVVTCRPVPRCPELIRLRQTVSAQRGIVLDLEPLSESESEQLAGTLTGARAGPRLRELVGAAGGNPLYVREIVDSLIRGGTIAVTAGVAEVVGGSATRAVSVHGAITDRLTFLSPTTRDVLRLASLLEHDLNVTDLASLTGRTPVDLLPIIDEAVSARVLTTVDMRLMFRHGLIRDAFYGSMPPAVRAALHRHAAMTLAAAGAPPQRVATQLMSAPDDDDPWTTRWLIEHGAELAERIPDVAEELLSRIVERPLPDESIRDDLEMILVGSAFRRRAFDVVERVAPRLLDRALAPERAAAVMWMLCYRYISLRRYADADQILQEGGVGVTGIWSGRLAALRALVLMNAGDLRQAAELAEEVLRAESELPDANASGYARHVLSTVAMLSCNSTLATGLIDDALRVIGPDLALADLRMLLLMNRTSWSERAEDAESSLRSARELTVRVGHRTAHLAIVAAEHCYRLGRWDDALSELDLEIEPLYERHRTVRRLGIQAVIAVSRGNVDDAAGNLAEMPEIPGAGFDRANAELLVVARAKLAERTGDAPAAVAMWAPNITTDDAGLAGFRHFWIANVVRTALAVGDTDMARRAAATANADAAAEPQGIRGVAARWCAALLVGDLAVLDACADFYRVAGFLPVLADVCVDAAVAGALAGDVPGARRRLVEATSIYTELGAEWDLRRADARLRALGVRRGQPGRAPRPTTGWGALTRTEIRVAEMVAAGLSNPDIAAELFLSRRTVSTHVSHILAKLGVRSRVEVAGTVTSTLPSPRA